MGTGFVFSGTASENTQLALDQIQIRAQSGERSTATIAADGQYSVEDAVGEGPWLFRSSLGNDSYHYGVAYPEAIAHIHSYTDVVLRNWFLARHDIDDIDTVFDSSDTLPELPSAEQFKALAEQFFRLVEFVLADYGLTGEQLLSEPFRTNDTGIDRFLDRNPVLVDEDGGRQITVVISDDDSPIQTSTDADILLGTVEGQSDTQAPSIPADLRALSGEPGEIVLVWGPSTDNSAVIGYEILRDGELLGVSPYPVYSDTEASTAASHLYEVRSVDLAGNRSTAAQVSTDSVVEGGVLSAPTNLVAETQTTQRVELRWDQEEIGTVAGFNVYRGDTADTLSQVPLIKVSSTSVTDATVSPGQEYWYAVTAVDALGNESPLSEPIQVFTTGVVIDVPDAPPVVVPDLAGLDVPDATTISCSALFPDYNIDSELTLSQGCYLVEQDVVVDNFGALLLQPGVVLKFEVGSKLLIETNGRLESVGTDENPVVLTGQQPSVGWWWGVEFNRSNDDRNIISHTVIEYHGSNTNSAAGIAMVSSTNDPSQLRVENSLIRRGGWYGIDVTGLDARLESFKGNLITENRRAAFATYTSIESFNDGSRFTDNTENRLFVTGASYDEDIEIDDIGIPLQIGGIDQVSGNIIINEGVELFFLEGEAFTVRENLAVNGTAENPVIMSSNQEMPGTWEGLQLIESANAQIRHLTIENAGTIGGRNPEGSNLFATNNARMSLENVTLRFSSSYGYFQVGNDVIIDRADNINLDRNARTDVVSVSVRGGSR